ININGKNVHPGSAKNVMINSIIVANELISMLDPTKRPEHTEGYEGFFHIGAISGDVENTTIEMIIRDFFKEGFENKKKTLRNIVEYLNKRYGNIIELEIKDGYYNMREKIEDHMEIVDLVKDSMKEIGIIPKVQPIRGGTDGARLSFMGLPCPNIFAGGYNFHSRTEFIPTSSLEKGSELLLTIVKNIANE
ncbi:MAG: tripeptide aminopeptidase PepT, partial [Tissierellia bacterium]|nr:tripeptide aminopeptidase PepT [Tissierellia bacterium]